MNFLVGDIEQAKQDCSDNDMALTQKYSNAD